MIETLSTSEAAHRLLNDDNANWSYNGAHALIEWIEDLEEDTGTPIEFDRVAIRCDFSEYESIEEVLEQYGLDSEEDLHDHTTVIEFEGGVIIQDF